MGIELMIDNRTRFEITDCLIYFKKRLLRVENISPEQEKSILIKNDIIKNQNVFNRHKDAPYYLRRRDNGPIDNIAIIQKSLNRDILLGIDTKYRDDIDSLQLIGWVKSGLIAPDFKNKNVKGEGLTLVHWKIPIREI